MAGAAWFGGGLLRPHAETGGPAVMLLKLCTARPTDAPHHPLGLQAALLRSLDWRVRLDFTADVKPCHDLLFSLLPSQAALSTGMPITTDVPTWAVRMHRLCKNVQQHVSVKPSLHRSYHRVETLAGGPCRRALQRSSPPPPPISCCARLVQALLLLGRPCEVLPPMTPLRKRPRISQ